MSRNIIWGFLLIVLYQGTNAKLCEIKKWYKDLQKNDFIVSNLNLEQEELIEKIEKKIRNSKFSGTSKVNCDILDEYELILSTDANRHKRKAPTKLKTVEKDTRDNDKYKRKSNDNEDDEDKKYKKYTSSKRKENDEDDDAQKNDRKDHAQKQDDEKSEIQSKNENIKKNEISPEPAEIDEEKEYDPTESDVDETELLEEELPSSTEKVKDESIDKIRDDKESSEQMADEEVASHQQAEHNATKDTSSVRLINLNQVCSKHTTKCSRLCYYGYQNQQSLIHYPGVHSQNKTQNHLQLENPLHVNEKSDRESPPEGSDNNTKAVKPSENESNDDTIDDENSGTGITDKQLKINSTDGDQQDLGGTTDKQPVVSTTADKEPEFNDIDKQQRDQVTTEEKDTIHKEDDKQNRNKPDSGDANDKETQRDSKINSSDEPNLILNNIDILLQQRATEYSTKISQLEILLMKLENKFLNQQLHKQNDSNSFSKLEFQIVKLENELLKLNQSYYKLSSENEVLRSQERQRSKSYAALPEGNSTKHKELITQQQVKISQLTDWLTNQTTNLNQLQDKSDSLAAQNQALYQIVMNQTALISSIMQKVQDLSEENLSYRKETQDLKSKINSHDASVKILEKLDSLGSKRDVVDVNQKLKPKQFHFLPDAPEASINRHLWKCNGLLSPQICYMFSILLSPCPPFSTVYWRKCPTYISEKTAYFFVEYLKNFPNGTEASKDKLIQKPTDPKVRSGKEQSIPKQEAINEQTKEVKDSKDIKQDVTKEDDKKRKEEVENNEGKKEKLGDEEQPEQVLVKDDEDEDDKEDTGRPIKYKSSSLKKPKDCYEVYQRGSLRNGVYKIFLPGLKYYVDVYCDMKNGGWTLIQKRDSGDVDFFKDWKAYKEGFGVNTGEHYLGNDFIHFLTNQGHYSLNVELVNWKKEKRQATYKDFWIDEEDDGYKLHIEGYGGDAGDGLSKHNEMKFSTHDVDNDLVIKQFGGSCAKRFHGAGWYYKCYSSNLNGQYYDNGVVPTKKFDGVAWKPWTGPNYSLKEIVLKVRPKDVL